MPELPEVEVVRKGLAPGLVGATVIGVEVRQARLRWPVPDQLDGKLKGLRISTIGRRGKYLIFALGKGSLIVHLGMSGNLRLFHLAPPPGRHDHIDLVTDRGVLRYTDPRRFGAMLWHDAAEGPIEQHALLAQLGVEPLEEGFDGSLLYRASRLRKVSVKQWLLSGREVVGVGNIYASESLFRAGIRPTRGAGRLTRAQCERLADAVRDTLREAIDRGGSTLRDFVGADGQGGYFQIDARVYGRAGEPCRQCGGPVRLIRQQQRATYFCPSCQP
jgi:formamidopyrimidine-DNA glycosylase